MIIDITCSLVIYEKVNDEVNQIIDLIDQSSLNIKLIVVDNSSKSLQSKIKKSNHIEYIHSKKNIGYGAAQNLANKKITGKSLYHIYLSPDMLVENNFFNDIFLFMETYKKINFLVPKILNYDGSISFSLKRNPNPVKMLTRGLRLEKLFEINQEFNYEIQKDYGSNEFMYIPASSGAVVIFRNLEKFVYNFDERYFLYMEDYDWFRRVSKKNKILFNPEIVVKHKHEAAHRKDIKLLIIAAISVIKYFNKWGWFIKKEAKMDNKVSVLDKYELKKLI